MSAYTALLCHIKNKQRRGNVKVLAPEAFSFVAWLNLCGRKLLVHRLRPFTSVYPRDVCFQIPGVQLTPRKRLVAEMRADGREVSLRRKGCRVCACVM